MKNNVTIANNYKPSTNIYYDIADKDFVNTFIPTLATLDLLEFLIQPILFKNTSVIRSHLLTGAYGKGKSFTVLLALNLVQDNIDKSNKKILVDKIRIKRPHLADKIELIGKTNKTRLLPILVKGGFSSLSLALSSALSDSLEKEDIHDIILESNFLKALEYIDKWEKDYKDAFNKLCELVKEYDFTENSFRNSLKNKNEEAISIFLKLFPIITNGSDFNTISEFQVIDDYKKVSKKIITHGYSGIFIVYDEFSKFLESNHSKMSEGDIKLLQDLAELANSSSMENQVHLSLISHKIPTSYFSDSKSIDEWEAISGRFDVKDLYGSNDQDYEIIEGMLDINKEFINKVLRKEKSTKTYKHFVQELIRKNIFDMKKFDDLFEKCFPFNPLSLYVLPRLSELVAQNERTIFSFMVSSSPNSLASFLLNNVNNERLYVHDLYDYFEPIFRNAPKKSILFKLYLMVSTVTNKPDLSQLSKLLVKTIAILIILNDEKIPATFDSLLLIYELSSYSKREIEKANEELKKYGVVRESDGTNQYIPFAIDPMIQSTIDRNTTIIKKERILQRELVKNGFIINYIPRRYNDKNSVTRYFKAVIISKLNDNNEIQKLYLSQKKRSNGIVFIILDNDYQKIENIINKSKNYKLCFFLIPKKTFDVSKFEKTLFEYIAIKDKMLMNKANTPDKNAILKFIMNDNVISIKNQLLMFTNPKSVDLYCYVDGKKYDFINKVGISNLCSSLYEKYLPDTVIFNREDINLEKPSKISIKARNIIVDALLNKSIRKFVNDRKTSQVYSIFNSLKYCSNIIKVNHKTFTLSYNIDEAKNNFDIPLMYLRDKFIQSSVSEIQMSEIISKLIDVDGGIGLKKGVVPFFLAIACSEFNKNLVFFKNGKEANINSSLFNSIVLDPVDYSFKMNNWDSEKESYINELCDQLNVKNQDLNIYDLLLQAMNQRYQKLPLQTRVIKGFFDQQGKVTPFSKDLDKFLKILNKNIDNPYSTIMEKIPYRINKNFIIGKDLATQVINKFEMIENMYIQSEYNIKSYISNKLTGNKQKLKWLIIMHNWVDSLTENEKMNLSKSSKSIVKLISDINSEDDLFNKLTYALVGLRFSDWGMDSIDLLNNSLDKILSEIVHSNKILNNSSKKDIAIVTYINEFGEKTEKKVGLSANNNLSRMFNDEIISIIEEMGDSLSREDINKILLDIIVNS